MDTYGRLGRTGDRWQLTFERRLAHPPERVWRAITEPEHLAAWFPAAIEGEWEAGAALRFVMPQDEAPDTEGEMLVYDPPRALEYRWGEETLRFDLRPDGDGCVLTFVNALDELGQAARDAAGWHVCLDLLGCHLAGQGAGWNPGDHWKEVHPGYVARFGPEASTIGPPDWYPLSE